MPIFARAKLVIQDDCMVPLPAYITLEYKGPNPQELYKKIKELFISVWAVDPGEVQETEFSWDRTAAGEKFTVRFEVIKDLDSFSFIYLTVTLKGEAQHSREFGREGKAQIVIEPLLRTEYPQDTMWQRSLFYEFYRTLYHKLFYVDTRKRYLQQCRETTVRFHEELKSFLNLLPKSY